VGLVVANKWKIIKEVYKDKRRKYEVQCSCGYIGFRRADWVDTGRSTSCKSCSAKETLKNHPNPVFAKRAHFGVGDITKTYWYAIRQGAQKRNIEFDITIEQAWELFVKQNGKCALSGVDIQLSSDLKKCNPDYSKITASLDRIDSTKGYILNNIQWVHKTVNYIKRDLDQEEFITWCQLISKNENN
jgi:hypothetical protein